jgi:LPS sulfotransferase NodH
MKSLNGNQTRFVILNAPRTGSNMLCTILNSHPEILCHHEIFNPHVVGLARHLQNSSFTIGTLEEREDDPLEFLGRVWRASLGHPCVGFKLCWRQNETIFRAVLEDSRIRKIVLRRRNRVKAFVSLLLARKTGQWVVYEPTDLLHSDTRVRVEISELQETIAFNEEYYREIEETLTASRQSFLKISYEELFSQEHQQRLLNFLQVSAHPKAVLREGTIKLNSRQVQNLITNFDELRLALRGSDLEAELHSLDD